MPAAIDKGLLKYACKRWPDSPFAACLGNLKGLYWNDPLLGSRLEALFTLHLRTVYLRKTSYLDFDRMVQERRRLDP
jgi:hypothetical protein